MLAHFILLNKILTLVWTRAMGSPFPVYLGNATMNVKPCVHQNSKRYVSWIRNQDATTTPDVLGCVMKEFECNSQRLPQLNMRHCNPTTFDLNLSICC